MNTNDSTEDVAHAARGLGVLAVVRRESSKLRRPVVKIKSICGPGDDAEPVITLMLPEED
jgi:hypothetical protein